ncbi:hypothetical protein [Lacrimispora indolis]|uniref:hypothetical protein n=1 Tax=Lacrimispora indolis TaxID=69825 RepID=UPI00045E91A0|nr:hypothetical protein [Lacrimispora indolis]
MEQVNTKYVNMPRTIKAYTVHNDDDTYTIMLNSRHNHEQLIKSYQHEIEHIVGDDFYNDKDGADVIKFDAHN